MSEHENDTVDRRAILAGGAALTVGALAGCLDEMEEEGDDDGDRGPTKPELPGDASQLEQPMRFLVESAQYQNDVLEELYEEI